MKTETDKFNNYLNCLDPVGKKLLIEANTLLEKIKNYMTTNNNYEIKYHTKFAYDFQIALDVAGTLRYQEFKNLSIDYNLIQDDIIYIKVFKKIV